MSGKLRLGIVGVGGMGIANYHARSFLETGRVELVACCDIRPEALATFGDRFGVPNRYENAQTMFETSSLDLVAICTNETVHAPLTILAAQYAPKAILCEKPMAMSLEEADAMEEACQKNGVRLFVGHQRRYVSQYAMAKELLPQVGEIVEIEASTHPGSSLLVDGTHTVDLIRFFLDDVSAEWVFGQVDARTGRVGWGHLLEDASLAMIRFQNGVRAVLTTGGHIAPRREALRSVEPEAYHRFWILGTRGVLEVNGDGKVGERPLVRLVSDSGENVPEITPGWYRGLSPHADLLRALDDGGPHLLDGSSARATLEILMAVYESARCRRLITLPLENRKNPFLDGERNVVRR